MLGDSEVTRSYPHVYSRADACIRRVLTRRTFLRATAGGLLLLTGACDVREFARRRGAKQRLSIATGPVGGVYYVYGGAIARLISRHVENVEATAEVTGASVDNLTFLRDGRADLALTIAPTLHAAYRGTSAFRKRGRVPARTLAVLYAQPTHLVTLVGKGIATVRDLKGKTVSAGTPGSGTEEMTLRILDAVGLKAEYDVRLHRLGPSQAAEALKDGKLDAFFWSAGVPSSAVVDLASTPGRTVLLVPTEELLPVLRQRYGTALFTAVTIPRGTYPGQRVDVPTVGVATLLVADESLSEPLAYEITKALFTYRAELEAIHPVARDLHHESAVAGSPVPFHPGAIRYYRETGAWPR